MKAYLVIVLISLLGGVLCDTCEYVSSDNKWYYDLSLLSKDYGKPYSFTNSKGETYYFNFCEDLDDLSDISMKCPEDSAVCVNRDSVWLNLGEADESDSMWADSPYGSNQGIELTYGNGETCKENTDTTYKTLIRLNCSSSDELTVVEASTDACFTTIVIRTRYACPVPATDAHSDIYNYHHRSGSSFGFFFMMFLLCSCCICITCCVRMCRRRRCNKKNCNTACSNRNGDYTAVEFQTFSESNGNEGPVVVPLQSVEQSPVSSQTGPAPYFMMYPPHPQQLQQQQGSIYPNPQQQQQFMYAPPMYVMPSYQPVPTPSSSVQSSSSQSVPSPVPFPVPFPVQSKESQIQQDERLARELQQKLNQE